MKSRVFLALSMTFAMIASIGVVPVAAVYAVAANASSPSASALVEAALEDLRASRFLENWIGDSGAVRPLGSVAASGPVEFVIGLEGRSLEAEQAYRKANGLVALDFAGQQAHVAGLRASQASLRASLEALGVRVLYDYQIVYNGFAISADSATVSRVAGLPNVLRIEPSQVFDIALDSSVPFIFGGSSAPLGLDGTGVTIAIIDTGIDYTHAALGGPGTTAAYASAASDPTVLAPFAFPMSKVIGGTDLVGEFYSAGCDPLPVPPSPPPGFCSSIPDPDPDPLDLDAHGTHVSGIAAGMGPSAVLMGVAPGASLFAIKVFALGSTSSAVIAAALELAVDPDGDGDTSDHVDVINMSLGGAFGRNTELSAVASNAAVAAGAIVVASAGNDGNIPYITGAPAAASDAISVAAGNKPAFNAPVLTVSQDAAPAGAADGSYTGLEGSVAPSLSSTGPKSGLAVMLGSPGTAAARACFPIGADLTGMIPLIQRGGTSPTIPSCPNTTFRSKILNAQAAGAIGVVVYNNVASAGPVGMGGSPVGITIPAMMVGTAAGLAISAAIDADTRFSLASVPVSFAAPNGLQSFTSRGPRFNDAAIKPDITAPGGLILSAAVGTGTGAISLSGTSMSAPHIAGVAALLRELHPDWSVEEIKALMMNTATNADVGGVPFPASRMGAGRVQVDLAVDTESIVVPASASFGVRERDRTGVRLFETELEVRNLGSTTKRFSLSSSFLFPSDAEGSITFVHPSTIRVRPGAEKEFDFGIRVNFNALAPEAQFEEYDGFLTLTETTGGGDALRVPFHIIPMARADAGAKDDEVELDETSTFTIKNKGIRSTDVDIYQFGVKDPNEDLIVEGPGMPNDPDNWFDIRHTGAHTFDTFFPPPSTLGVQKVIEFGVSTHGRRSAHSMVIIDVFIDVDGGGSDFVAEVADLELFIGPNPPFFSGTMVSGIFSLATGTGSLQFFVSSDRNQAWQTVPFLLSAMNGLVGPDLTLANPDFDYFVVTTDLETGAFDVSDTASFNVFAPGRAAAPGFFGLAAGASADVIVTGSGPGDLLVLYYNNVAGQDQSQRIEIEVDDDDDGDDEDDDDD